MLRTFILLLLVALAYVEGANAAESRWIEVQGHAAISGEKDRDAARRRALADALFNAALAGGADVRGHTAISKSVITSDLTIVRAVGRVLEHDILAQRERQGIWEVTVRARVGVGGDPFCQSPHRLVVSAYAPIINVSPHAPAWTEELARQVTVDLIAQLDRHPATDIVRITDRTIPTRNGNESLDYTVLTKGSVRMQPGELGFVPVLTIRSDRTVAGDIVVLEAELQLHQSDGSVQRQVFRREVSQANSRLLGRMAELTRRDRQTMARALTAGLRTTFDALLDIRSCEPLVATLANSGGKLTVPIGRKHGLSRASLAFTAGKDRTTELLEVLDLGATRAVLRPLDPGVRAADLAGLPVRFVEAAW